MVVRPIWFHYLENKKPILQQHIEIYKIADRPNFFNLTFKISPHTLPLFNSNLLSIKNLIKNG